jgi:hypothetical protein
MNPKYGGQVKKKISKSYQKNVFKFFWSAPSFTYLPNLPDFHDKNITVKIKKGKLEKNSSLLFFNKAPSCNCRKNKKSN